MEDVTFDKFISLINSYNQEEVQKITKAYEMAKTYHAGQKRESGEDYIIHPLYVAYILGLMHADADTVCAGLLHDTLEDTTLTKEEIVREFNSDVANLVDGVTKISNINFISKEEMNYANVRKLIRSINSDIRIIIIKLADRLHNMRTLYYKTPEKQKAKALETMELFAPLAKAIGAYTIKKELEDLSFAYLEPNLYEDTKGRKEEIEKQNRGLLLDVLYKANKLLCDKNIPNEMKIRSKSVYSVFKYISEGKDILSLHDLLALKVIVDSVDNCYVALGSCHSLYKPVNEKFKDYIANPKTTNYQALHTTVFAEEKLIQFRIRTQIMDKIADYGLTAYWDFNKGEARNVMQSDIENNYRLFDSLNQVDNLFPNNKEFVDLVKNELFSEKVYICNIDGEIIELPKGSNVIDFAYYYNPDMANKMIEAYVNGEKVPLNYVLNNKDIVNIITSDLVLGPDSSWFLKAQTGYAKQLIKNYKR